MLKPTRTGREELTHIKPSYILEDNYIINSSALTLCTVLPFVANGTHAVAIGAGAVAAAKRVDALRDGDITLRPFPATVAHTGALVVLAVTAAQHRARRWRNRPTTTKKKRKQERLKPGNEN